MHTTSTKTRGATSRLQASATRRDSHPRRAPVPAAPTRQRPMRALDAGVTAEQRVRLWAMTRQQRIQAMDRGELALGELAAWSARRQAEVPLIGYEFAYIAKYDPEYCETAESEARS